MLAMEPMKPGLTPNELAIALGKITVQGVYRILKQKNINANTSPKRKIVPAMNVRQILMDRGFKYPKSNISCQIVKGGAGKTTIAFNLACRASHYGVKVLAIDFDQQGNLSRSFNIDTRDKKVWINVFRNEIKISDSIIPVNDCLHLIPSNLNNSRLDIEMIQNTAANPKDHIHDILAPIRGDYDLVIMDCPPAINRLNAAVTCASDLVVIPINPDQYSIDGMHYSISELQGLKKSFKLKNLDYKILWNRYDAREKSANIFMHHLAKDESLIDKLLPIVIRSDTSVKNVIIENSNIFESKRKPAVKEDIDQLCREIIGLNSWIDSLKEKKEALA